MKSFRLFPSLFPLFLPPLFSSSLVIIFKSPPMIYNGCIPSVLIVVRVFMISILCMASWGKYTLVRSPCILVPIMWKFACMKFLVAWKLLSKMVRASHMIAKPLDTPSTSTTVERPPGHAFTTIFSRAVELYLVSCKNRICGLSCIINFLSNLPCPGPLSPLIFHDINFIGKCCGGSCSSLLA